MQLGDAEPLPDAWAGGESADPKTHWVDWVDWEVERVVM